MKYPEVRNPEPPFTIAQDFLLYASECNMVLNGAFYILSMFFLVYFAAGLLLFDA